jgi:hypothetical protein
MFVSQARTAAEGINILNSSMEGDSDTAQPVSGGGGGGGRSEKRVLKRVLDDSDELNCSICMRSVIFPTWS